MSKYVSKIDGKVFETKEELISYLESEYVKVEELNENSAYSQILSKLNEAFPEATIDISESSSGEFYVDLSFDVGNDMLESFYFYISDEDKYGDIRAFEAVEDAIEFYERYPKQTDLIREGLADKYELESFKVEQWHEANDYYDTYHMIMIKATLNGVDMLLESGLSEPIDHFIKTQVEPYFTNEIEGELKQYYQGDWYVDGSDLAKFLNRAKKVRVTIIESK